jgi:lambda repressor-like predicted transcriptional regulator
LIKQILPEQKRGMTSGEIKAELVSRGVQMQEIAAQAGVTISAVSQTIYKYSCSRYKGRRIRPYIAKTIGKSVSEIWTDDVV